MNAAVVIRKAREMAGLSKRELARRAGISPAAIVRYESGQTSPTVDTLNRILEVAGWRIAVEIVAYPSVGERNGILLKRVLDLGDALPKRKPSTDMKAPVFSREVTC